MPHRLDHLDRYQLVVLPLQIPVVTQQHGDAIRQAGPRDTVPRQPELLLGDRCGCHLAAVVAGHVDRKTAPSSPDLEHVVVRTQLELATDAVVFRTRRFDECSARMLEVA